MVAALKEDGVLALNVLYPREQSMIDLSMYSDMAKLSKDYNLKIIDIYIWDKPNPVPCGNLKKIDIPAWEPIFVFSKNNNYKFNPVRLDYHYKSINKAKAGNKIRGNGVDGAYGGGHRELHPKGARQTNVITLSATGGQEILRPRAKCVSFPMGIPERFVLQYTDPGDLVVDPFSGIGTTCFVAKSLNRNYLGFEIDQTEVDRSKKWLATI